MSFASPHSLVSADDSFEQAQSEDRRRHKRLSVTVCARLLKADGSHRVDILDVSDGGMLLSPIDALTVSAGETIQIASAAFGKIKARIVCVSRIGIHVQIEMSPCDYPIAVERLFSLTRAWAEE